MQVYKDLVNFRKFKFKFKKMSQYKKDSKLLYRKFSFVKYFSSSKLYKIKTS